MNILLYKGTYQYNVINEFINNCINILKNKNCNVIVIDEKLEQENTFNKIVETFSNILIQRRRLIYLALYVLMGI